MSIDVTQELISAIRKLQVNGDTLPQLLPLIQQYSISRCADALEQIADHIVNGQIATLEGENIVKQLGYIHHVIREKGF